MAGRPGWPGLSGASRAARASAAGALLVALVACVYWPTLENGFVWDDDAYVQNNLSLRTPEGLGKIWLELGATPQYYPLVHTSFWVEYHAWQLDPRGYHAVNLALHALAAVLLWRLLARLEVPGAWLAAAVFAVHPVQVESVAWVTERKNVLSLACALGSLLAYLRAAPPEAAPGVRPTPAWRYGLALVLYVAALLAKTVTSAVPAVLLVIAWWKRGRIAWRDVAWLAPFFAIGLALSSVTVWMERTHVGAVGPEWRLSLVERALVAGRAVWFYAGKLAWPDPLIFFYPRWTIDAGAAWQFLFPAAAIALVAGLWLARRRIGRGPLAAVLVFVGVLAPALGFFDVFPFRYSFVADHFQYHASIALIAAAVAGSALAARRLGRRAAWVAPWLAAALLLALGAKARRQTRVYHDPLTLYASVVAANPGSWAAQNNLGRNLLNQHRYAEAIVPLREASRLRPDDARIRNNLGAALSSLGRLGEAEAELTRALSGVGEPTDFADTRVYLAVVLIEQGRFGEAAEHLRAALEIRPRDAWALYNLGVALGGGGDLGGGAARVEESLAIDPTSATAHHELGAMRRALGDRDGAIASFREAVRLEPANAAFETDLGSALLSAGDLPGAEQHLQQAVRLDPGSPEARNWLGIALGANGDLAAAEAEFEAALRADPGHAQAQENLRRVRDARARPPAR